MTKVELNRPLLLVVYGFPGAGKTTFARQLCDSVRAAHIHSDRIRFELFEKPKYDKAENQVVNHLVNYMLDEFLSAGVSVVFDADASKVSERRRLREIARKNHAQYLLVWFQIDIESAFTRVVKRDRRTVDDKYSRVYDRTEYDKYLGQMQHPTSSEDFLVLSGKHSFAMQRGAVMKRLYDLGMVNAEKASANVIKPGMVNLVPNPETGTDRRNIRIR